MAKIYAGDIFKCSKCNMEVRIIKAGKPSEDETESKIVCCGKEMENIGGLDPANSW